MRIFSWENIITVAGGMLLGLFVALGTRQFNIIGEGAGTALVFAVLILLGAAGALVFLLQKKAARQTYEIEILREVAKAKDRFMSMLLHFIRTPLTGIRWQLKQFYEEETDEERKNLFERLHERSVRLSDAVTHLLDVSRASLGQIEYNFQIVPLDNLRLVAESVISSVRPVAEKKGLTFEVSFEAAAADVRLDKSKIDVVMQTLLDNAIRYTKEGRVTVKLEKKNRDAVFSVSDTGLGIPEEEQDKIFIQFFRAKNARQQVQEGFGVGLFLAKLFIEKHGGKIWFTSQLGKGSAFFFSLPLVTAETEKFLEKIR